MKEKINKVKRFKQVVVSEEIYESLKNYGKFGDSFNDIVTRILEKSTKDGIKEGV
ncbi:MAG: antitoxin VapB family protein [Candidatus Nitrosocosmicus sp.]